MINFNLILYINQPSIWWPSDNNELNEIFPSAYFTYHQSKEIWSTKNKMFDKHILFVNLHGKVIIRCNKRWLKIIQNTWKFNGGRCSWLSHLPFLFYSHFANPLRWSIKCNRQIKSNQIKSYLMKNNNHLGSFFQK